MMHALDILEPSAERSSPRTRLSLLGALALVISVLFISQPVSAQVSARFPSSKSELASLDGRYVLQNVDQSQEPYHSIFLKDTRTGNSRKVYEYGRSVGVVWAPDSLHFAVNDYAGSNITETTIFSVDASLSKTDVQDELVQKGGVVLTGGHDYFGVVRWLDSRRMVVHFWGHTDDPPVRSFCECYLYTLQGSVSKCSHQPKSDDPERQCEDTTP
jgi:hypothetical protein